MTKTHTRITEKPINIQQAMAFIQDPQHGAMANFIGTIRNHNVGRDVISVNYDVFIPLAEKVLQDLCKEVRQQWGNDLNCFIEHYKGQLNVGGISVIVMISSVHREEAFKACRYIIEGIKHKCPIWKQERYVDGVSQWVKGHALCAKT